MWTWMCIKCCFQVQTKTINTELGIVRCALKSVPSITDRFMADIDTAFVQQTFNIAK